MTANITLVFVIWLIVVVVTTEYFDLVFAPSNIIKSYEEGSKPKYYTITLADKFQVQKGGSLLTSVYNEYTYYGHDVNGTSYTFKNNNDSKYHFANINSTITFVCYFDKMRCE